MNTQTILLIPEKSDIESNQVASTWMKLGGAVKRLGKYWVKDEELEGKQIAIYGNQTFSLILAQIYDVELLSPDDSLIARLEHKWAKRIVQLKQIAQITETDFPVFIKPVIPKLFIAGVFQSYKDFRQSTAGLHESEQVLVSGIVSDIRAEARCYVMNGMIKDIALYEGEGDLSAAKDFLASFIRETESQLPAVIVIDIAYSGQAGWFVLEFNACWGAGLNNCKAERVIGCIINATINKK